MVQESGKELIFVISQPRSGSTLLQRILGGHPEILTVGEPWLMLGPLYMLRENGHTAEYGASQAARYVRSFLDQLPQGVETYHSLLRKMYVSLYSSALQDSGCRLFLDKTPRYYFIVAELAELFPQAKIVVLLRNPLAVMNSIVKTWCGDSLLCLHKYRDDLLTAPQHLAHAVRNLGKRIHVLQYEELVNTPESTVREVCGYLEVEFLPQLLVLDKKANRWDVGDQESVYKYTSPKSSFSGKWLKQCQNPQLWRLYRDYLNSLEGSVLAQLGYDKASLGQTLEERRPSWPRIHTTRSLDWFTKTPIECRSRVDHYSEKVVRRLGQLSLDLGQKKGVG